MEHLERPKTSLKTLRALLSLAERYGLSELHCNGVYLRRGGPAKQPAQAPAKPKASPVSAVDEVDQELLRLEEQIQKDMQLQERALSPDEA